MAPLAARSGTRLRSGATLRSGVGGAPQVGPIKARGRTPNRAGFSLRAPTQQQAVRFINVFDSGVGFEGGVGGSTTKTFSAGTFSQGTFSGLPAGGGSGVTAVVTVNVSVFDSGVGVDTAATPSTPIVAFDSGVGSDSSDLLVVLSVSDAAQSGDFTTTAVPISVSDSGVGIDTSDLRVFISVNDEGVQTEVPIGEQNIEFFREDAGVTDDEQVTDVQLTGSDIGVGLDSVTGPLRIGTSDVGVGSDVAALTVPLRLFDSGFGSEAASVDTGSTKRVSDSGRVFDTVLVSIALATRIDFGRGHEAHVLTVTHTPTDSGVGAEHAALPVVKTTAHDAAVGADTVALHVVRNRTDSGTVVDRAVLTYLQRNVFVHDAGVGHDFAVVGATVAAHDEGHGHESRSVRLAVGYARDVVASAQPTWKSSVRDIVKDEGDDAQ